MFIGRHEDLVTLNVVGEGYVKWSSVPWGYNSYFLPQKNPIKAQLGPPAKVCVCIYICACECVCV